MDFLRIVGRVNKKGVTEIYPKFIVRKSSDLMIRGGDFYAVWNPNKSMWSTDEDDAIEMIDSELDAYAEQHKGEYENGFRILHVWDSETRIIDLWHKYCQHQMRDHYKTLDEKLIFSNMTTTKEDYCSKRLSYALEPGDAPAWEHLISTLYFPEERHKIEWAIGSVVSGDSKKIQKFMVLYGEPGTGKSTILNIIELLFEGYVETVDAKSLGNASASFALETFKTNPLVAVEHDSDLSRVEDNTRLNRLVSHEKQTVNEKHKTQYTAKFNTFLFLGTNKPVKITDAKSGLLRRLIDVTPSNKKLDIKDYRRTMEQIRFELGKIAFHCKEVYEKDPLYYDTYIPLGMMELTNDFFNYVSDAYYIFKRDDGTSEQSAWDKYNDFCEKSNIPNGKRLSRKAFRAELKNYFQNFEERPTMENGTRVRKYYSGFRSEKFHSNEGTIPPAQQEKPWLIFEARESLFDQRYSDCFAQYANESEKPIMPWDSVTTRLSEIDTSKTHYVRLPENQIVIDFDIPDENGNKCFEKNLEAALLFPKTYAELSKSGEGIHLHYNYTGDPSELSRVYGDHIEIKVFTGKSSLRRKLTKCNDIPLASITNGLPIREKKKMTDKKSIQSEAKLVELIERNLRKEIHPATKPSVDFIYKILEDAYNGGMHYDVKWMFDRIYNFASNSTNQAAYCQALVAKMKFESKDISETKDSADETVTFFDIESAPNHFLVCSMLDKDDATVVPMLDPKPDDIYSLIERKLVGFNNRGYDNHMLYGKMIGDSPEDLHARSNAIIQKGEGKFNEAYNLSYTDIYDFSSKKQSLKKFEIELGLHHQEFPIPWDQPVPDDRIQEWIEYCCNDVRATRALFHSKKIQADFTARKILAALANGRLNDSTNQLTTRIIFGSNQTPQSEFNYRDMGLISEDDDCPFDDDPYTRFNKNGQPVYPGYKHEYGKSIYRDEDPKQGGYVYAEPGIHCNVALLDIASMHPSSIIAENLFGDRYTPKFKDILDARIAIKHKDFEKARTMLNGALAGYLTDENAAKDLAYALKIAINAVYGQTSARYKNPFRDTRNVDNIVAKRGALFMINLKHAVQKRGYTVAHIKTDSIKIPNADSSIISFVKDYGKMYGYNFEHEATYDKMCLVNDSVYVAKYASNESCEKQYGYIPGDQEELQWTATGAQFQVPYVFKTLFSHEPLAFEDFCETREVKDPANLYLDFNEKLEEGEHNYIFIGKVGLVCPVKPGAGGGELMRGARNKETGIIKYDHASSSVGYRWLEAETVKNLNKEELIDRDYYRKMADKAAKDIAAYGDLEWFLS